MHTIRCTYEHLFDWTIGEADSLLEQLTMFGGYQFSADEVRTTDNGSLHFTGRQLHNPDHVYSVFLTF